MKLLVSRKGTIYWVGLFVVKGCRRPIPIPVQRFPIFLFSCKKISTWLAYCPVLFLGVHALHSNCLFSVIRSIARYIQLFWLYRRIFPPVDITYIFTEHTVPLYYGTKWREHAVPLYYRVKWRHLPPEAYLRYPLGNMPVASTYSQTVTQPSSTLNSPHRTPPRGTIAAATLAATSNPPRPISAWGRSARPC